MSFGKSNEEGERQMDCVRRVGAETWWKGSVEMAPRLLLSWRMLSGARLGCGVVLRAGIEERVAVSASSWPESKRSMKALVRVQEVGMNGG